MPAAAPPPDPSADPHPDPSSAATFRAVAAVLRARRTSLLVDPDEPVPEALLVELIELAALAPNHKRTWPWRFTVIEGDGRARFGDELAAAATTVGFDEAKVAKLRTKYRRSPVVVLVWDAGASPDPVRRLEDRDAVAAAVENLLLAATAAGLASHWASVPTELHPAARSVAGVGDDHQLVALVYLGWPTGEVPAPPRPLPQVAWVRR
jgi:nitroreductase